jgi:enamine deaminase RidA (YjgF/YER057c/UK114 family)
MTLHDRRQTLALMAAGLAATAGGASAQASGPAARLTALGIELPKVAAPLGSYVPYRIEGRLLFISGQLPTKDGKLVAVGRLPTEVSLAVAQTCSRQSAINILAAASAAVGGDLGRIAGCVKLTGYVAGEPGFTDQPLVMNPASDLMREVFGEAGRHARAAVGVASLPLGAPVEIEAIFALTA